MTTAVILAGGLGTRLRPVVDDRPKPMADIAGRPFLEHLMSYWLDQGIKRFILSVGYRADQIERYFGTFFEGSEVEYVHEQEPMGTGGALLLCQERKAISESFLLLNGDTFFPVNLRALQGVAKKGNADWVLSLFPTKDSRRYMPIKADDSGRISFGNTAETQPKGGVTWANGGVYWVNPRALAIFTGSTTNVSLESGIFPRCVDLGQTFFGLCSEKPFIDIGVPEDYAQAQKMAYFLQNSTPKH
jgi:D-glycero-alpha-D-manno-heptose 1-phosphate guanylyltransferase